MSAREDQRASAAAEFDRWEKAIGDELARLFDRQEAVVIARLTGTKARKHTRHWEPPGTRPLEVKGILDPARWLLDAVGAVTPILRRLYGSVYKQVSQGLVPDGPAAPDTDTAFDRALEERGRRIAQGVETAVEEVEGYIASEESAGTPMDGIVAGVRELYERRKPVWAARIATLSAVGSVNHAGLLAAMDRGSSAKQWLSSRDDKVRPTHEKADGQVRLLDERFRLGGIPEHPGRSLLMLPGDPGPTVPIEEVINCRCSLLFSPPRRQSKAAPAACGCCGGSGEHLDGHECYVCDASGQASEQAGRVCEGHHGRPDDGPGNAQDRYGADFVHKSVPSVAQADLEAAERDVALVGAYTAAGDGSWLEAKDRIRTAAGAAHYGQPIGSVIKPDVAPTFVAPSGGTPNRPAGSVGSSTPGRKVGTVAGAPVDDATADPAVWKLIAQYSTSGAVPEQGRSRVLALRDRKGRIGAYVAWQTQPGANPAGQVTAVSVHPSLQGKKVGDQLVALAMQLDPQVQPTSRPRTSAPAAPPRASVHNAPSQAAARPATGPGGLPVVRDRSQPGDQPGTSGDFDADAARIERLQRAYMRDRMDTTSLFSKGGRWSRSREKQQQDIIDHFLGQQGVRADGKLLVLGGLPGAGKTTTINSSAGQGVLGIDLDHYVTVNADEVKEQMVARGMVPDYPGLDPDEAATLFHAESFEIAHSLMRQAAARGLNFAYDTSMKSAGQVGFATAAAARSKKRYETTVLFVDVPLPVAKQRARDRYLAGGRYMPLGLIDGMRASSRRYSSGPSEQFDAVKRSADRWFVFDNAGAQPVVLGQGGRRGQRP